MGKAVGIDLGTTNSLVAYMRDGVPAILPDSVGNRLMPSVVSVGADGAMLVGGEAQRRLLADARRSAYSVKRFMGRDIADVRHEASRLPFRLAGETGGVLRIGLGAFEFTPPEISAFILRELKRRAEAFFARRGDGDAVVDRAVITVPAYFNGAQRAATRDAGRLAGLDILRILNEPTAASLAYGLDRRNTGVIAVYDFGGGTFDISILRVEDGIFQVLSTNGDTCLGGDDIDAALMDHVLARLALPEPLTAEAMQALRAEVIQTKCDLSEREEGEVRFAQYALAVSRAELEALMASIARRTLAPCRQALADADLKPSQVDEVVLVGGSTRIPLVRRMVGELFGRVPHTGLNPDEVVALGAAVHADGLARGTGEVLLLDVTPLSLGIETLGGATSKLIARNSTIPAGSSEMFTTAVDNQTAVDIHVVQGEREFVGDNRSLARFRLRGIPPLPAGLPRVQVRFQIDADGLLTVTAVELRTGIEQTIDVKPSYGLTDEEIERMLLESFEHAAADEAARLLIEARTEGETIVRATERVLRSSEFPEIASAELASDEARRIEVALEDLKAALAAGEPDAIQAGTRALNEATRHLAEATINRAVQAALSGRTVDEVG